MPETECYKIQKWMYKRDHIRDYIFNWICIEQSALFYESLLCLICALGRAAWNTWRNLQLFDGLCIKYISNLKTLNLLKLYYWRASRVESSLSWTAYIVTFIVGKSLSLGVIGSPMFMQHQILFQFNLAFTVLLLYFIYFVKLKASILMNDAQARVLPHPEGHERWMWVCARARVLSREWNNWLRKKKRNTDDRYFNWITYFLDHFAPKKKLIKHRSVKVNI